MDLSALKQDLGDTLLTKGGEVPIEKALEGKTTICLYFSAHWCPPCRGFTPVLSEVYSSGEKGSDVEVVFISSDRDEASFDAYYGEMPWCALPFKAADKKAALSAKYEIQGIPTLVILKKDGTVDKNGRGHVMGQKNLKFD
ncbi:tryparedoxin-like [Pecten maximus]|uniref:tryparedoxin-like n=1 Tax=Pecten maximus TaxID=6579 RepID=UPI001457EC5E|nr:tryparedoxin-like [Pecten maximus]